MGAGRQVERENMTFQFSCHFMHLRANGAQVLYTIAFLFCVYYKIMILFQGRTDMMAVMCIRKHIG